MTVDPVDRLLLSDLPPDVIDMLLQRMSSRDLVRAIPTSREIAAVGSDILRRRERHTLATFCPTEVPCQGSLLCAILADDADAVEQIIFYRGGPMRRTEGSVCAGHSFRSLMANAPCRILRSTEDPGIVYDPNFGCFTADYLAVAAGAQRALDVIMANQSQQQIRETWYMNMRNAIESIGQVVWLGRLSPTADNLHLLRLSDRGREYPTTVPYEAQDTATVTATEMDRAVAAITWSGEPSPPPPAPITHASGNTVQNDVLRQSLLWTVEVYDAPAVVRVILERVTESLGQPSLGGMLGFFRNAVRNLVLYVFEWGVDLYLTSSEEETSNLEEDVTRGLSLPEAYRKLLNDMGPFFLTPVPRDEQELRQFVDMLDEVERNLAADIVAVTQWPSMLEVLLDAVAHPWRRHSRKGPTEEQKLDRSISILKRKAVSGGGEALPFAARPIRFVDVSSIPSVPPLERPLYQWVGRPILLGILEAMAAAYAQRLVQPYADLAE